jgi:putative transcriptional regulator
MMESKMKSKIRDAKTQTKKDSRKQSREPTHFARHHNTSESTVQKWEIGANRPSVMALRLLQVVK